MKVINFLIFTIHHYCYNKSVFLYKEPEDFFLEFKKKISVIIYRSYAFIMFYYEWIRIK